MARATPDKNLPTKSWLTPNRVVINRSSVPVRRSSTIACAASVTENITNITISPGSSRENRLSDEVPSSS